VEQVVDLGRVDVATQDDHLNLHIVDVRNAIEDQLDVVNLRLDEVLHLQVGADRAVKCLLAIIERLELYRHREQALQDDRVDVAGD
jgi:hypothetical protein